MKEKEIVEKILEEYSRYGLGRIEIEISYLLAIIGKVPKDSIYPGMRMIFNQVYGIKDDKPAIDAGKALFSHSIEGVRQENPLVTDQDVAKSIDYIGIDTLGESIEDIDFTLLNKVKETMLRSAEEYVLENQQ